MRRQIGRVAFGHFCPLPYPMLLEQKTHRDSDDGKASSPPGWQQRTSRPA